MKKIIFIAMLFIACAQGYAQSLQVNNNIPGISIQFKMRGHNIPGVCNSTVTSFIPTTGIMTWNFLTPGTLPLIWNPPYTGLAFSYDACYWEVVTAGGVMCSGTIGRPVCGWPTVLPIPCIPGVHTATWILGGGGSVTVNFN